ncbi:pili assembly chaperone [Burkholderia sp. Bp9140]|uniref:toxin co-regulated pilus biosynthesis Q family protein n=1 Tax=Burkholderia sp. Bp9140 TaxID=2184572 RepID=UPI000F5764CC|nr:toxin co-regulated pilus biosynthesis Q family protein [Burkholderia sp. Bp9140]RQR49527.1 pili assembly chaperone [Burkholderia sp. Bp9140]
MRTIVARTVLLSALGAAWSSCACAANVAGPDAGDAPWPAASASAGTAPDARADLSPPPATGPDAAHARQPEWATRRTWRIELSDRTMRSALARWAQTVGWQLVWEAPGDFGIDAEASVTGTFDDALRSVVGALAHSNAPIQAILYRGNKVLRIVSKGAG